MESNSLESRVKHLETTIICLSGFCATLVLASVFTVVCYRTKPVKAAESGQVLHLRGLVIDDAQGRARVLLGAPFPTVNDRLRQDPTTAAMVFLDEHGHDRFLVGEEMLPQINGNVPSNFHRIGAGYGLTIFDSNGNERGGMGFLSNGSTVNRATIALDRPGLDAVGAYVDDRTGFAGMGVEYPPEGADDVNGIEIGTQGKKAFITVKGLNNMPRATFGIGPEQVPSFHLFDKAGKPGPDLLGAASPGAPVIP